MSNSEPFEPGESTSTSMQNDKRWMRRNESIELPGGGKAYYYRMFDHALAQLKTENATSADLDTTGDIETSNAPDKLDDISMQIKRLKTISTSAICDFLRKLRSAIEEGEDAPAFEGLLRKEFIAAHLVLNQRVGSPNDPAPAPGFRPQPARSKKPKGNAADLSNIVRLIDLHFCWSAGHRPQNASLIEAVFGEVFDFDEAFRFVQSKGRIPAKLKLIELSDTIGPGFCRAGNVSLLTDTEREAQRRFRENCSRFKIMLGNKPLPASVRIEEWAEIVASARFFKSLGVEVSGHTLKLVLTLIGRSATDRPNRYLEKYKKACKALGLEE